MTQVEYIYHSCFLVSDDRTQVVIDYWRDPEGRLARRLGEGGRQLYFVVTHFHPDHYIPAAHVHPMHCWDEDYRATLVEELPLILDSGI